MWNEKESLSDLWGKGSKYVKKILDLVNSITLLEVEQVSRRTDSCVARGNHLAVQLAAKSTEPKVRALAFFSRCQVRHI